MNKGQNGEKIKERKEAKLKMESARLDGGEGLGGTKGNREW